VTSSAGSGMSRSILTLMLFCMSAAGCVSVTERATCPISPKLNIEKTPDGYLITEGDMRALLHYVEDLEFCAQAR